jgi:hypothetical protein
VFCVVRRQLLIHERHGDAEAAVQPVREAPSQAGDLMLAAIGMGGQANDQQHGPPFGDQAFDRGEACAIIRARNRGQGMREPGLEIPDCDADAPRAEVERQDGSRPGVRREA